MKALRTLVAALLVALLLVMVGCSGQNAVSQSAGLQSESPQSTTAQSANPESSSSSSTSAQSTSAESASSQSASWQIPDRGTDPEKFVIIHTNDAHGYLLPGDKCLGLAAVTQLKADYIAKGYDVLLLDGGDVLQGDLLVGENKGKDVPGFMTSAGYDAMALGNHEFDYGSDVLQERMEACGFPVLCANIVVDATGKPFARENHVFTLGNGMKVGVFALDTPSTSTTSRPTNTKGLTFLAGDDLYKCAQDQIDGLRAEGCAVVVCLAHLGETPSSAPNRSSDVVAHTTGLDVLIDAHDHEVENATLADASGKQVPVVETGCYLANIGVLTWENGAFTEELVATGAYNGSDEKVAAEVKAAEGKLDKELEKVVGKTPFKLNGDRRPGVRDSETNLGDFCTDAVFWIVTNNSDERPDAAILNGGALRTSIEAGDVTLGDLRNVMPFDNQLCTVKVTGKQLLEALEAATQDTPEEMGGFPQVSGIAYSINTAVPYVKGEQYPDSTYYAPANPGSRVTITDVGGKGFDLQGTYTIATINFIAQGGDTYYCFAEAANESYRGIGYVDYQAIRHFLKDELGGTVPDKYAEPQGRITEK